VVELGQPCRRDEFRTAGRRPLRGVLDTGRAERALQGPLPKWEDAVERFLSSPL